jgi:NTP pyrophosphatase (non-canonical NTP hydrolase)
MKSSLTLEELTALIMEQAKEKGFGLTAEEINVAEKIALIHTEVSEAYTAYRHKKIKGIDGFEDELGDIIQRVLHLATALNIDIEAAIIKKLDANKSRQWKWDELNEESRK